MELLADDLAGVQAHLQHLGWLGDEEPLEALESPGAGNMNRTLRARTPGRTFILKQAVPYVAKYPQIPAPVQRLEAEAAFYAAIAATDELRRHTPQVLGEDRHNHLLCLEDLGCGGDLTSLYAGEPHPVHGERLATLAGWLGALHALPVVSADVPDNLEMRRLNHAHVFEVPFDHANGVALPPALRDRQQRLANDAPLRRRARELGAIYLGEAPSAAAPVLLHGDYYPGSWLAHAARSVAVIDPEFGFVGAAEFDVGVFTAHLTMSGLPHDNIVGVLRHYCAPPRFDRGLATAFAGMEMIRRLLGVAQLPLAAGATARLRWLEQAADMLTA